MSHLKPQREGSSKISKWAHAMATFVFCTRLATVSAIVFFSLYGMVVLSVLFGHPLYFPGLVLSPLAGAIGGPLFGVVYSTTVLWRGQAKNRGRAALLSGALGGVNFVAVGAGFQYWDAAERSCQPTMHPVPTNPEGSRVSTVQKSIKIVANSGILRIRGTPEGGQIIERRLYVSDSGSYVKAAFAVARVTVPGGFLYGALFGAMFATRSPR